MKIKNVSLSFFILASLIVSSFTFYVRAEIASEGTSNIFLDSDGDGLSNEEEKTYGTDPNIADSDSDGYSDGAEVRSGYNPLVKAPGDKLSLGTEITQNTTIFNTTSTAVLGEETKENLTETVAQKITALTEQSTTTNTQISLADVQALVEDSIAPTTISDDDLPVITRADIKIKAQNYENLSTEKATAQKKEDFLNYITAVTYIFSSNSPKPLTSLSDATGMLSTIVTTITTAISSQNSAGLEELIASQKKITEQLRLVEVPEDLVDTHIKALRFALYSEQLVNLVQPKEDDPLGAIANLSKIQGFITVFSDFITETENKISEYGITYDENIQEKLKNYGIDAPDDLSGLESLLKTSTDTISAASTTTTP